MTDSYRILTSYQNTLITGTAGFIGYHLARRLLADNPALEIIGIDCMNDYYDVRLKEARLRELLKFETFRFIKGNIANKETVAEVFGKYRPQTVVSLAAQAGVRHSIIHPDTYMESNVIGFYNLLEACRHSRDNSRFGVRHLVFACSSSVYDLNRETLQEELVNVGVLPSGFDFEAHKQSVPMQPGDMLATYVDISDLERLIGFRPSTSLREGLCGFAQWYTSCYMSGLSANRP